MFRIVISDVPSAKIHHTISILAATRLAQNCTFHNQDGATDLSVPGGDKFTVEGDWMNKNSTMDPDFNVIVGRTLPLIKKSVPVGARVMLEVG